MYPDRDRYYMQIHESSKILVISLQMMYGLSFVSMASNNGKSAISLFCHTLLHILFSADLERTPPHLSYSYRPPPKFPFASPVPGQVHSRRCEDLPLQTGQNKFTFYKRITTQELVPFVRFYCSASYSTYLVTGCSPAHLIR